MDCASCFVRGMGDRVAGQGPLQHQGDGRAVPVTGCVGFAPPPRAFVVAPEPSALGAHPRFAPKWGVLEGARKARSRSATAGLLEIQGESAESEAVGTEREGFGDERGTVGAEREGFGDEREGLDTPREGFVRPGDVVVVGDNHGRTRERRRVFHGSSREGAWRDLGADG